MLRIKCLPLFFLFLLPALQLQAQHANLTGTVVDSIDYNALYGASIFLFNQADSSQRLFTTSDEKGAFVFKNLSPSDYRLIISFVGYQTFDKVIALKENTRLGNILMLSSINELEEIEVNGEVPMAVQKGDTVQFNADAFKVNPDATAEDLAKKMPGVVIDDDNIQAQGEDVQKVLVDGRPFFGDDPRLALRTIPAEVIEKIEIFDKLSDQAEFTGFDDGQSVKTMNIVTRPEARNGQFGRAYAGYGTDDRYNVGGNVNFFDDDRRISVVAMSNNVNQQNFATEDLLGVMSSGSRRRGGPPGGPGGGRGPGGNGGPTGTSPPTGGSANDFMVGPQDGITNTHSAGINYSDKWGEKIEVTGSYFFNASGNSTEEYLNREYIQSLDENYFYEENSYSENDNYNHRLNIKLDYQIDTFNSILWRPRLSLQNNQYSSDAGGITSYSPEEILSTTENTYNDHSLGYNFDNDLLFRHSFKKRGRTISLMARTGMQNSNSDNDLLALNRYFDSSGSLDDTLNQQSNSDTRGYDLNAMLMYTEPISDFGQLQLNLGSNYSHNYSLTETYNYNYDLGVYNIFDTTLSSEYNNDYFTNRFGTGLRFNTTKMHLMFNLGVQRADLVSRPEFPESLELEKTFVNFMPDAMMRVNFSRSSNLRVHYRSNTDSPSISQLQDVIDNSDPLSITSGNPDLKQEYSHSLMARYSLSSVMKSKFMYVLFFVKGAQDYIANASYTASQDTIIGDGIILGKGSQYTIPVNLDGYWNARTFFTLGLPLKKLNLNLNTGVMYSRVPGLINGVKNLSATWSLSQGFVLSSNISENLDFTFSWNSSYYIVNNSIQEDLNNNYYYQTAGLDFTWIFWKGLVLRNTVRNQYYTGLSEGLNDNYFLWNVELGKKFLKNQAAEVKIGVYDILDENRSISRTVSESYIEDSQVEVLRRYAMISFTYNLKNFRENENKQRL